MDKFWWSSRVAEFILLAVMFGIGFLCWIAT